MKSPPDPDRLLALAEAGLGAQGLAGRIAVAVTETHETRGARSAAARLLANAKTSANQALQARFSADPLRALDQIRALADLT